MRAQEIEEYLHSGTLPAKIRIATKIAAGLAASDKTFDSDFFLVQKAYSIADEIIAQSLLTDKIKELRGRIENTLTGVVNLRHEIFDLNNDPIKRSNEDIKNLLFGKESDPDEDKETP